MKHRYLKPYPQHHQERDEDIASEADVFEYGQGRSRKQVETSAQIFAFCMLAGLVLLLISIIKSII